jgi:hypothetical protein
MPGFFITGQEVKDANNLQGPNHKVETRRKHRWIFEQIASDGGGLKSEVLVFLKTTQRPAFKFEEPVMDHNQEKAYFAGRQEWDPIKMSFYDVEQSPDVSDEIWNWLNSVNAIDEVCVKKPGSVGYGSNGPGYKGVGYLSMVNGCGTATERWSLFGAWPKEVNWQDLDYSNTEIQLIEVTLRFDRAIKDQQA